MSTAELFAWVNSHLISGENGCMLWNKAKDKKGYGHVNTKNGTLKLHRFVLEQKLKRPIGENMCALHTCNVPACCNPNHIVEGTNKDNVDYKVKCNRQAKGEPHSQKIRGEKNGCSKLTEDDVKEIRNQRGKTLQYELAEKFGISRTHVSAIQLNRIWKHVS